MDELMQKIALGNLPRRMVYGLFDQPVFSSLALVAGTSCVCYVLWLFVVGSNQANPTVRTEV